jgi:hypothetical protein
MNFDSFTLLINNLSQQMLVLLFISAQFHFQIRHVLNL